MPDARSLGAGRKRKTRFQPPRARRGGGGGGSLMRTLTLFLGLFTVAEAVGGSGQPSDAGGFHGRGDWAVGNARTDLYTGMPGDLGAWLDDLLDNRLRASTMRTISRGLDLWDAVRVEHGWPQIIGTDDMERGAKIVTLVRSMMLDYTLTYGTLTATTCGACVSG